MITREDMLEQSAQDFVFAALTSRGYSIASQAPGQPTPAADIVLLDSFPYTAMEPNLTREYIASGFNFDTEGEQAELGSSLVRRLHTIQYFIFGTSQTYARNLANVIKYAVDGDARIPLKDLGAPGTPVIDYLIVVGATSERQIIPNPEPFQENVFTATLRVEDEYDASLS